MSRSSCCARSGMRLSVRAAAPSVRGCSPSGGLARGTRQIRGAAHGAPGSRGAPSHGHLGSSRGVDQIASGHRVRHDRRSHSIASDWASLDEIIYQIDSSPDARPDVATTARWPLTCVHVALSAQQGARRIPHGVGSPVERGRLQAPLLPEQHHVDAAARIEVQTARRRPRMPACREPCPSRGRARSPGQRRRSPGT